jgi:ribonuclease HII
MECTDIVYHYQVTDRAEIDRVGIHQANHNAMVICIDKVLEKSMIKQPHLALIDGNKLPKHLKACPAEAIVKGDTKCQSISAASILCKVVRDRMMDELSVKVAAEYKIAQNRGYGTKDHRTAIADIGPCNQHRKTFDPVKSMLKLGRCDPSIWNA